MNFSPPENVASENKCIMDFESLKKAVSFRTSRSSGAGGQHVNKVETKVEVLFEVETSDLLTEAQKNLVKKRLANRITKDGILILSNQSSRSQLANKEAALNELHALLEKAIIPPKKRKKVKPLVADKKKRLDAKKKHGEKKAARKKVIPPPE